MQNFKCTNIRKVLTVQKKNMKNKKYTERISAAINRRSSALSSNKEIFDQPLGSSGFKESLFYCKKSTTAPTESNRNRNIIWFNPHTAKMYEPTSPEPFWNLIKKHFPPNHNLHPYTTRARTTGKYATTACRTWIVSLTATRISLATTTPHRKTDATVEKKTNALQTTILIIKDLI